MSKATPIATPPPAPVETSTPMEQFLEAHFKKLVLLFAVIAVGAVVYGITSYAAKANAVAAGEAFASAKTVEDCDLVISEYSGSLAAGNALLLKADLLWTENKKDSSVAALREFTTKHSSHPLMAQALLGLATKLESMKEADEAKGLFERVISEFPDSDVAALAQLRLGDLLWSTGKEEEAKAAYESLPAKFVNADPAFIEQSEGRLKWISAKLPTKEVDGPPKPKVETPAPATPGAPQLKLNSTTLNPTILPDGATSPVLVKPTMPTPPAIEITPAPEAPKIEVTPMPTPEAPKVEVKPAPAPEAPKMEVKPAPAPEAPKVEVKPTSAPEAPKVEVPVPAPAPEAPQEPAKAP